MGSKGDYGRGTERQKRKMGLWRFRWDAMVTLINQTRRISSREKTSFQYRLRWMELWPEYCICADTKIGEWGKKKERSG